MQKETTSELNSRVSNASDDQPEALVRPSATVEKSKTEEGCRLEVARSVEHVHGPGEVDYGEEELVVVSIVRDGQPHIESFVDHYLSLGVKHIAFLDNNSEDGTVEALKSYENVTVLRTGLPYKASGLPVGNGWTREVLFKQYLISRFGGKDRWCLCVDIDELFDYPYSDVVGLDSLLRYLTGKQYTAVVAQMLDMFPEEPLSSQANQPGRLKTSHKFYDVSNIHRRNVKKSHRYLEDNKIDSDNVERFSGGIRESLFGHVPQLSKMPLVFNDGQARHMDTSHRSTNVSIADITGVLLHYKFLDGHFHAQVEQAVREEHRLKGSATYKVYKATLDVKPSLQIKQKTASELKSVNDLVENEFLTVSEDYVNWVNTEEENSVLRAAQDKSDDFAKMYIESRRRERYKTLRIQQLERNLRAKRWRNRRQLAEKRNLNEQIHRLQQQLGLPAVSLLLKSGRVFARIKGKLLSLLGRSV